MSALGGVDQASQNTTKSMLHAVAAGTLLAHGLEKASELLGELGHSFLENAEHMESARVTMEALYTTAAEGDEKFKWLWDFAQKNPVMGMDAATEIFMALKNNGIDPTTESLKAFGDAASAIPSAAKMLPQGIAELIEGRYNAGGVLSPLINLYGAGKNRVYDGSYSDKAGVKHEVKLDFNDAKKATDQLVQILNDRFGGSMKAHEKTWFGLTQRMKMDWQIFTTSITDRQVFSSLESTLESLLSQWEAFTQTDDFRRMLSDVSGGASLVIKLLGMVASAIGTLIRLLGKLNDVGGMIMAGGFFLMLSSGSIVGWVKGLAFAFGELHAALQLVAEGESIVAVMGALMNVALAPVTLIIAGVGALIVGIGYLIKKWGEFKNGLLDSGPLKSFFEGLNEWMARFGANFMYVIDKIQIGALKAMDALHLLGDDDKAKLASLQEETKGGRQAMSDRAAADALSEQSKRQNRADAVMTVHRAHPDWNQGQVLGWVKENKPEQYKALFEAPKKLKETPPVPVREKALATPTKEQQQTVNHYKMDRVTIVANNPEEMANGLAQANGRGGVQTATTNNGQGGKRP